MRPTRISIGDFNWRVSIYTQSEGARDAYGNPALDTSAANEVWANVKVAPSGYVQADGSVEYRDTFEITLRRPLTISEGDRIDFEGQELQVTELNSTDKSYYKVKAVSKA